MGKKLHAARRGELHETIFVTLRPQEKCFQPRLKLQRSGEDTWMDPMRNAGVRHGQTVVTART